MSKYNVITPTDIIPAPSDRETRAAGIIADYFKSDVKFIRRSNVSKTADLNILSLNIQIEVKSPTGKSKRHTIERQFVTASKQARYLAIDSSRTALRDDFIWREIVRQTETNQYKRYFKNVFLIRKDGEIVDLAKHK